MAKRNLAFGGTVPMDPGERDKPVTIQRKTKSVGSSGFPVETFVDLVTVFMKKDDQKGSERFVGGQLSAPTTTRWESSYRTAVDPELVNVPDTFRLVYQGRVYDIVDATLIGSRDGIEFLTLAKVG